MKRTSGFTLIEVMLSLGIIALLCAISLPVYQSFQVRGDLSITAQKTADAMRRAQTYARGANYDSAWGTYVQTGSVTLYKGATYASRDTTYDETFTIPTWVTVSASTDLPFAKLTGAPSAASSVTLSTSTGSTRTLSVNAEGMVSY